MHVLFITNYFPPEVNAPATRIYEHSREWVKEGGSIEIITAVPNYPEGHLYPGYKNEFSQEQIEGIQLTRVPVYIAENKGTLKRTLSYISFMISAVWYSRQTKSRPDVVVASSPQFFSAIAGYLISRLKRVPFVFEVRDMWPDSIVAVEAIRRNWIIKLLEKIEYFLYLRALHIVVVTDSFKRAIAARGIDADKISVLKNGADLEFFTKPLDQEVFDSICRRYEFKGRFVVSYIGTIGMAHGIGILIEAALQSTDPEILFVAVGAGAERDVVAARQAELNLSNFVLIEKQPKELVRYFLAASDVCIVHLKDKPLFLSVLPSKIFEAMAMRKPLVVGLKGETRELIEDARAGIPFAPEDARALVEVVRRLHSDRELYERLAHNGFDYVARYHDRKVIARRYWALLIDVAGVKLSPSTPQEPNC